MVNRHFNPFLLNLYLQDRFIKINFFFGILVNISLWLILVWWTRSFPELIPLHYNIYFGIDLFGPWYQIFILPLLGLIFFLINFPISSFVYRKEKILSYFLVATSSFVQIIFVLAIIFIIFINY